MIATALAVLLFQQATGTITAGTGKPTVVKIHITDADTTHPDTTNKKKRPPIAATPEQIGSAYVDDAARAIVERARAARFSQDASIQSYEAHTLQRFTIGIGFSKFGRDRVLFRSDNSARVRWARDVGAQVDVTGRRSAAPALGAVTDVDIEGGLTPIPYYPGRDGLWLGLDMVKDEEDADDVIHPLARNAEAFYTYKTGEAATIGLPDGTRVSIREVEVRPRKSDWHAVVGSLWFDESSGQLVRAAFRMSKAIDVVADADSGDKPGAVARLFIPHTTAVIDGVAVEYGLYQGHFWLPRSETIQGNFTAGFARVPMSIEERFTYSSVNALDTLPIMREKRPIPEPPLPPPGTSKEKAEALRAKFRDSVRTAREKEDCAATGQRPMRFNRFKGALPMTLVVPCDVDKLASSPELPGTLFGPGDAFSDAERDALLAHAMSMMPPVPFGLRPPAIEYGLDLQRYNRVEGLSLSADITEAIAPGTSLRFSPRMGTADRVFNGELSLARENGFGTRALTVYRRLNATNDWGRPLSFGSGLSAFLFGRDEGFYYRSAGAELAGDNLLGHAFQWRLFTEKQSDAVARTNVSLPHALGSDGFDPVFNIAAQHLTESGASIRKVSSLGLDPNGFRLLSDLRLEAATGTNDYGRGALDLTLSHPIGRAFRRDFSGSITGGAGTSIGDLPIQRNWYLGGTNSVRGQPIGAAGGSAYWLTRTELGYGSAGFRRVAFFDLGWAGSRDDWSNVGRPASGVGLGWSFIDGLVRADLARGIYPTKQWHFTLYLDGRY